MPRRLGLLGGTFDPPHLGHLVVAECARVELPLDEVRLLVAGEPWMKGAAPTSAADRVRLTEAAVADDPHLRVDLREVRRAGPTITADTLAELHAEEPDADLFFLLGEDAATSLPSWKRVEDAFELATFVVVTRPGHPAPPAATLPDRVIHLEIPQLEVSSTQLRQRYAAGLGTRYLVPDAVEAAIVELGLYGTREVVR